MIRLRGQGKLWILNKILHIFRYELDKQFTAFKW